MDVQILDATLTYRARLVGNGGIYLFGFIDSSGSSILLIKKPGCETPKIFIFWCGFSNGLSERFAFFWRPRKSWTSAFWRSYVRWPWIGGLPQRPRNTYRFYQKSSCPNCGVEPISTSNIFFRSMTTLIFCSLEIWGRWVNLEPHVTSLPTSNTSFVKTILPRAASAQFRLRYIWILLSFI